MIDFNSADLQSESTGSAIPEGSIVPFKMTIRTPPAGKEGSTHALFCRSKKNTDNEYIDVEFEAVGTYAGRKVWQMFTLVGSDKAAQISMRTLRAIVESSRGIAPSDTSSAASAGRQISDWADFNGMTFLAQVKCVVEQSQKDGHWLIKNEFKKIITPDDEAYAAGEHITDAPLPLVPDHTAPVAATPAVPAAAAAWGAPVVPPAPAVSPSAGLPTPAWATR